MLTRSSSARTGGGAEIGHWFQRFSHMLVGRVVRGLSLTAQCLVVKRTPPASLFAKQRLRVKSRVTTPKASVICLKRPLRVYAPWTGTLKWTPMRHQGAARCRPKSGDPSSSTTRPDSPDPPLPRPPRSPPSRR